MFINEKRQDRVAIIYGRFQPLSRAHYNMIRSVVSEYQEAFVFVIQGEKTFVTDRKTEKGKKSDMARKLDRNPLPVGTRADLILKAIPELDSRHVLKGTRGEIRSVISSITRMYPKKSIESFDIYAGPDEYPEYVRQAELVKSDDQYKNLDIEIKKFDEGTRIETDKGFDSEISGTKLRAAIIMQDKDEAFKQYKKMIAPPLADMQTFEKLRAQLSKIQKIDIEESLFAMFEQIEAETMFSGVGEGDDELENDKQSKEWKKKYWSKKKRKKK